MIKLIAGTDYFFGYDGGKRWHRAGVEKIIAAGLWRREFSRGKFGSPDAELKTQPPSVDEVLAMAAKPAAPVAAPAASSRRSIIPNAAPQTANVSGAASADSPEAVAANINEKSRRLNRR